MKKTYKKILSMMAIALITITGCKNELDLQPTDAISAAVVFETVADLEAGIIGVYAGLDNPDIGISTRWSDENYYPKENNANVGGIGYRWEIDPDTGDAAANWSPLYSVVYRVNRILRVIDQINAGSVSETAQKNRIKGELLAVRAYAHFQLLRSYAENYNSTALGIPYLLDYSDNPTETKPARTSVGENFLKIEADLLAAKQLIPASFNDVTRVNLRAVSAIQSRVYLYEKKWDQAITTSSEVINAVPLASITQFPGIWTDANNSEIVWKLKRESGNSQLGAIYRNSQGLVYFAAAIKLISSFNQVNDVRFNSYIKIDNSRSTNQTKNLVVKYVGGNSALLNLTDVKLFRTAESYLIRAEAYAQKNRFQEAADDINTLRSRRITGYTNEPAYSSVAGAINDIYYERFKELAFEGHRYYDLRRQGLTIDRNPIAPDDNSGGKLILTPSAKEYYLPIPGTEIRANANILQNPVYVQ
jgi:hypothetical protein